MSRYLRMFVILAILLSGLAILPYAGLTTKRIGWEQFAGAYAPAPAPPTTLYFPLVLQNTTASSQGGL
ncbi:MAG TPA: hypothetical protein VF897_26155 [Roseiflexaceae bacterium]